MLQADVRHDARLADKPRRLRLVAQPLGLGAILPRRLAIFALGEPGRGAARQYAEHHRENENEEQRRGDRESRDVAIDERIEGNGDDLPVGESEDQQQHGDRRQDEEFEKILHVGLLKIIAISTWSKSDYRLISSRTNKG